MPVVITHLCIYPVKGMHGIAVSEAELTVRGLKFDRTRMVIDESGLFLTQRNLPKLAVMQVKINGAAVKLENPDGNSLTLPENTKGLKKIPVTVWSDTCEAFDEGDEASDWLTDTLGTHKGRKLRMVRFNDEYRRNVDRTHLKGEDSHTAFADGFPYLITSESSLNRLNERLIERGSEPVPMNRFRPNIVIKGLAAFRENRIDELASASGAYRLGIRKPCKRCKVTTVDQDDGNISDPKEPLRTLTLMNTVPGLHGAYFGQNATLLSPEGAVIRVGDDLMETE
ncbi:MAG: MOSC domain-containing protein [Balneolaceae bacterium]|nr:MAG: MOSC domain-containing protein [Balneolaceae bacterium]